MISGEIQGNKVSGANDGGQELRSKAAETRFRKQIRGEQDISSRKRVTRDQEQIRVKQEIERNYRENN